MISRNSHIFRLSQQTLKSYAPIARIQLPYTQRNIEKCSRRAKHSTPVKNTSFVFNAFLGKVDSTQVVPYPNVLDSDQSDLLKLLLDQAERAINEINDPLMNDELGYVPDATLEALKASGAYGLQVPEQYGGAELNNTQYGRMTEVMGAHDLGLGVFLTGHQGIGFKGILICGTDEQKEKYLPQLATGEKMAAFALTEPASGSDANSISTRATLSKDGQFWILNGSKIWITGGGLADIFTVFAKTEVKDEKYKDKMTAFIVERKFGGVTNGPPEQKMGIKCSNTAELYFDNTHVPVENVLGGVGNGFKVAMQILNNGRFGMGTSLSGTMRNIICKATQHVSQRVQFGSKLQAFGSIQEKLARMSMYQYANESMAYMVSGTMDSGHQDYQLEAAVSKVFSSEAAWWVTDEAIQILGGMGYMKDSGLEKIMRDLRIFRIFEGTNDILRLFIALTGMQYAGSHLKHLRNAAKNPLKHENMSLIVNEIGRRSTSAIGDNNKIKIHPNLHESSKTLCQDITKFGQCVEMLLMKHQKNIIQQQFLLNRVAAVAIDLYVSVSVLSRCSSSLEQEISSAQHEQLMANLWCSEAHTRIGKNLATLSDKSAIQDFVNMAEISRGVCNAGKVVQPNPVGF